MSDNKRPLGDFSQENNAYDGVSTSFNGKPVPKQDFASNLPPSSLFSNNPINQETPGTFVNKNKQAMRGVRFGSEILSSKAREVSLEQKELASRKEKLQTSISSLFAKHTHIFEGFNSPLLQNVRDEFDADEINTHSKNLKEEIKNLKGEVGALITIDEVEGFEQKVITIDRKLQDIKDTIDGAIADTYEQVERLRGLSSLQARCLFLSKRSDEIYKKADQATKTKILALFSPIEWLTQDINKNKEMTLAEIIEKLDVLEEAVSEEETLLKQKESTDAAKKQETLSLLKELFPLAENYNALKKEFETLPLSDLEDTRKETLQNKTNKLATLKKLLEDTPTRETFDAFKKELSEYADLIEEAVGLKKETIDPRGIWSGWPESRFVSIAANPKQGIVPHLVFVKENGDTKPINPQESTFWNAIKTNFDTIFKEYEAFLKKDSTAKKIKELPDLIASKNIAVEGILSEDIGEAASLIEVFRIKLAEVKEGWDAKIKKEGEDNIIKQEKAESKKKLLGEFNDLKKQHGGLAPLYERVNSEILSEEERKLISKYHTGLTEESAKIAENFTSPDKDVTPDLLENFSIGINEFEKELSKIESRLTGMRPRLINKKIAPPLRTRFGTTNKNNKIILRDGREITVEEWDKEQAAKYPHQSQTGEQTEEQKLEAFNKTLMQHKEMYGRNPKEYLELYSHKNWVAGDINKKASEELLTSQLASLTRAEESLNKELEALSAKLATSSEEEKVSIASQLENLKQKLQLTKEEISSINNISYNQKIAFYKNEGAAKTLRRMKEVYSPAQDSSFTTTSSKPVMKGPFKTIRLASAAKKEATNEGYISEEEASLQNEQLEIYRGYVAEIKAINKKIREDKREGRLENVESDLLKIEEIKNKINLLIKKDAPSVSMIEQQSVNHYSGMVKGLDQEEATLKPGAYPLPEQAKANPEQTIHRDTNSPEQIQDKRAAVGNLMETREKSNFKKLANDWRVWMAASITMGLAASLLVPTKNDDQVKSPQKTLEQMMSWRYSLEEPEIKAFVNDFVGKNQLTEIDFMKKYIPLVPLDTHNPSTIAALSAMECERLLKSPEIVYGLNNEQRKQVCTMVRNLEKVAQAVDSPFVKNPNYKQNDYIYTSPQMTLGKFYAEVKALATQADLREANIKK